LKYVDQDNAYRRQVAAWYEAQLANHVSIEIVPIAPGCECSRHLFQVQVADRDEVMAALNSVQIFPGVHYRDNTVFRMFRNSPPCPNARKASLHLMSLPMHLRLGFHDVRRVGESLVEVIRQRALYSRGNQVA
jgi:dTDP-4-amino-4,6-dideoxygalactose transaminase